jgi:hypothetical protein
MSDDAILNTDGVLGADFTSLFVLFTASDSTVAAEAGAAADAVAMASVDGEVSSDGAGSTFLDLILAFSSVFFLVIFVGLIRSLVGMAMVGLTKI